MTNAASHVMTENCITITMDLKDFFPSVTFKKVRKAWVFYYGGPGVLPEVLASRLYIDKRTGKAATSKVMKDAAEGNLTDEDADMLVAEQGLPTSPMLANIAASVVDMKILDAIPGDIIYTRYADDLTLTFPERLFDSVSPITEVVQEKIRDCGFTINERKTKRQWSRMGRRVVTGYSVESDVRPTRAVRRKLRAAEHNGWHRKASGLAEFCKLTMPKSADKVSKAPYDMAVKLMRWGVWPEHVLARFERVLVDLKSTLARCNETLAIRGLKPDDPACASISSTVQYYREAQRQIAAVEAAIAVCILAKNS